MLKNSNNYSKSLNNYQSKKSSYFNPYFFNLESIKEDINSDLVNMKSKTHDRYKLKK